MSFATNRTVKRQYNGPTAKFALCLRELKMKSRFSSLASLLSLPLTFSAAPAFAAYADWNGAGALGAGQADSYFQADTAITMLALVVAASSVLAARFVKRQRNLRLVHATSADDRWRNAVYHSLEVDLQEFSARLGQTACSNA